MATIVDLFDEDSKRMSDFPIRIDVPDSVGMSDDQINSLTGTSKSKNLISEFDQWANSDVVKLNPGPFKLDSDEADNWSAIKYERWASYLVFGITGEEMIAAKAASRAHPAHYWVASVIRVMAEAGINRDRFPEVFQCTAWVRSELLNNDIEKSRQSKRESANFRNISEIVVDAMSYPSLSDLPRQDFRLVCYLSAWMRLMIQTRESGVPLMAKAVEVLGPSNLTQDRMSELASILPYLEGSDDDIAEIISITDSFDRVRSFILERPGAQISTEVVLRYAEVISSKMPPEWEGISQWEVYLSLGITREEVRATSSLRENAFPDSLAAVAGAMEREGLSRDRLGEIALLISRVQRRQAESAASLSESRQHYSIPYSDLIETVVTVVKRLEGACEGAALDQSCSLVLLLMNPLGCTVLNAIKVTEIVRGTYGEGITEDFKSFLTAAYPGAILSSATTSELWNLMRTIKDCKNPDSVRFFISGHRDVSVDTVIRYVELLEDGVPPDWAASAVAP